VWLRYPCELEATCEPATEPDKTRLSAGVRNISNGGINLVVNRRLEPGLLLSVELPSAHEPHTTTALAYVVHATAQPNGDWSVGCTFLAELSDDDLHPFGAKRTRTDGTDRRTWVRFPCNAQATFQLVRAAQPGQWPAKVVNISANGVALQVTHPIEAGTLLNLELRGQGRHAALTILAYVVRVAARETREWLLGCNFIRE